MASRSNIATVLLLENDVPGAKLVYFMVEKHSNAQLKRWLNCRGLKCSGNKEELVERLKNCIETGNDKILPVSVDGGHWYDLKLKTKEQNGDTDVTKPPLPPITGWNNFPSVNLPKHFNQGHIHHHIIESVQYLGQTDCDDDSDGDIEDLHTAKPMKKGADYFTSEHVQGMRDCSKQGTYFLKATVLASYETSKEYFPMVQISTESGFIKEGSCDSKASAMGRCSHFVGLLTALKDYIDEYVTEPASCTSKSCELNKGRTKKTKSPERFRCLLHEFKKRKVDDIITYNPTPTMESRSEQQTVSDFLSALQSGSQQHTMWQSLLFRIYDDYVLDNDQKLNLQENVTKLTSNISVSGGKTPVEIVEIQCTQKWLNERRVRITASSSKTVANAKSSQSIYNKINILKNKLWFDSVQTKAMKYGRDSENGAFLNYKTNISTCILC